MNRRVAVRVALVSALLGALLNAAINVATDVVPSQWRLGWWSLPMIVVVLGLLVLVETRWRANPDVESSARMAISSAVTHRWTQADYGPLDPPGPMAVPWVIARPHLSPHAPVLWADGPPLRLPRVGSHREVINLYRKTPTGQLIIIGEPGSGKTALAVLLLRHLLHHRKADEPVPMLVTLTDWDPGKEIFWTWLSNRLVRDLPGLASPALATTLLKERAIVPFLDGLDEMVPARHAEAITQIKAVSASGFPFVLTCRTKEYETAVMQAGQLPPRAVVVEMAPVLATDAFNFLRHSCLPGDQRWEPVFAHLKDHPDGPVADALSTPLVIWLASEVYGPSGRNPAVLVDATRFPNRDAVITHLLDAHLPTVYGDRKAQQAIRWLRFLAGHLKGRNSRDLLWWRLSDELPRWSTTLIGLALAITGGGIGLALVVQNSPWTFSVVLTALTAVPVGIGVGLAGPPRQPASLRRWRGASGRRTAIGVLGGAAGGLSIAPISGIGHALFFTVLGVLIGLGLAMIGSIDLMRAVSPRSVLTADASALLAAVLFGLTMGAAGGSFAYLADVAIPNWLGGGLTSFLAGAFAGAVLFSERGAGLIHLGRRAAIAAVLGGALVGGAGAAAALLSPEKLRGDSELVWIGMAFGLAWGIAGGLVMTSWLWYRITVATLWARGLAPWRLARFLQDAHRRGVFRQAGAGYQFRHALLQDRLADHASECP